MTRAIRGQLGTILYARGRLVQYQPQAAIFMAIRLNPRDNHTGWPTLILKATNLYFC